MHIIKMKMEMFRTYYNMKRMEDDDEDAIYLGSSIPTTSKKFKLNIQLGFKLHINFVEIEIKLHEVFYEIGVFP